MGKIFTLASWFLASVISFLQISKFSFLLSLHVIWHKAILFFRLWLKRVDIFLVKLYLSFKQVYVFLLIFARKTGVIIQNPYFETF